MHIEIKRSRLNGNKVVTLYVNGVLFNSYVDQVKLQYNQFGCQNCIVKTAEQQARDKMNDIFMRNSQNFKHVI